MQKTTNYQLNQWEATDKLSRADFNSDNAKLDAALAASAKALSNYKTANDAVVAKKAEQSALESTNAALAATAAALGSGGKTCRIVYGTYKGTDEYGEEHPNILNLDFYPVLVIVGTNYYATHDHSPVVILRGQNKSNAEQNNLTMTVAWGDSSVSWYGTSASAQSNSSTMTYHYVAIGYDASAETE